MPNGGGWSRRGESSSLSYFPFPAGFPRPLLDVFASVQDAPSPMGACLDVAPPTDRAPHQNHRLVALGVIVVLVPFVVGVAVGLLGALGALGEGPRSPLLTKNSSIISTLLIWV